jgi:hypothetical protein
MRTVLSWSYRAPDPAAARAFRLLGAQPGPEITLAAAAVLLGEPEPDAGETLDRLTGVHLVESERPEHYRLHDVPRAYAAELAAAQEAETAGRVRALLDWYVLSAVNAMEAVYPGLTGGRLTLPKSETQPLEFADAKAAYGWFESDSAVTRRRSSSSRAPAHWSRSRSTPESSPSSWSN